MKTILTFVLILALHIHLSAQSNILHRVTDPEVEQWELGEKAGYADEKGNMVIPLGKYKYCYSEKFDKMAIIGFNDRQGVYAIDRNENVLFEVFIADNGPDRIQENSFRIISNKKIGYADTNGHVILPPQFDAAWPFREGFAGVSTRSFQKNGNTSTYVGKWKFINKKGIPINNEEYDDLRSFEDGKASVMKNGKWGKINNKGVLVTPMKYTFDELLRQ